MAIFGPLNLGATGGGSLGTLFVRLAADITNLDTGMKNAEASVDGATKGISRNLGKIALAATTAFAAVATASVREFSKFDASFTGVRKALQATEAEFNQFKKDFRNMAMETGVNVNEINRVAEMAGSMGIANNAVKDFTRIMVDMGVATNLSSDAAAEAMAQFATATGMAQKDYDRLSSTIVKVGADMITTEAGLMNMATRLAGAGKAAGMTQAQIIGMAGALSSVGVEAEAGGTAMSTVIINMSQAVATGNKELTQFAEIVGVSRDAFKNLFREDSVGTIGKFIEGLQRMAAAGEDTFTAFDNMGAEGMRLKTILLALQNAGKLFTDGQIYAKQGWDENISRAEEARKRYATFEYQIKQTINTIKDIAITIGEGLAGPFLELNTWLREGMNRSDSFNKQLMEGAKIIGGALVMAIKLTITTFQGLHGALKLVTIGIFNMAESWLGAFNFVAQTIGHVLNFIVNSSIAGINKAIELVNKLIGAMPKKLGLEQITGIDFKLDLDTSIQTTKDWETYVRQARANMEADLISMYSNTTKTIVRIADGAKEKIKEVAKEVKQVVDQVGRDSARVEALLDQMGAPKMVDFMGRGVKDKGHGKLGMSKAEMGLAVEGVGGMGDPGMMQALTIQKELEQSKGRLSELQKLSDEELKLHGITQERKLQAIELYGRQAQKLQMAQAQISLQLASTMFGDLSSIAEAWGGKQSAAYKTLFAISKAFAIADATIKIAQGIAGAAAAQPFFPVGLAAMASVIAATSSIVSNIQAVKLEFGGAKAMGGPVSPNKAFLVGERGPELFIPSQGGDIVPNNRMGGATKIIVNNYTDAKPEVTERQEGDQKVIEIMIRRVKNEIGSEIRDGRGNITKAMESSFNLRRGQ